MSPLLALAALAVAQEPETPLTAPVPWFDAVLQKSDLKGYAELRGSYTDAEGTPWLLVERLRPTLEISPSDRFTFETTLEAHLEQGRYAPAEAEALMREQLGDELFDLLLQTYGCTFETERTIDELSDVLSVDRLFVDLNLPALDLRVGRQAINWGSALVFNPTDVFAEVIVAEPWRERKGVDAARVTVPIGERAQIVGVGGVLGLDQGELTGGRGGVRGTVRAEKIAASLVGFTDGDRWFGGADLKGDLGVGWWVEGGYDGDLRVSAGLDYSFPVLEVLYVAGQVSYDGSGSAPEDYDWSTRSSGALPTDQVSCESAPEGSLFASGETESTSTSTTMGRLYALGVLNWSLTEDLGVSATTLWNLEDGTGLVFPSASYKVGGRLALNAGVQVLLGEDGEFRPPDEALQVQGGLLDLSPLLPTWTASAWARWSL